MVKEPLYLPGDKQELFDRYLDKTAHADLIERLRVITGALQNNLHRRNSDYTVSIVPTQ